VQRLRRIAVRTELAILSVPERSWWALKRRTLRKFSSGQGKDHHNVYVVLLDAAVGKMRKVRLINPKRDPKKPCVYVGLTGLAPEERFANHKQRIKSSGFVKRYGIRLMPELYEHLNPMPYEAAAQMEKDLTEDLRRRGIRWLGDIDEAALCKVSGAHCNRRCQ
jgi:hypothetical protein